MRGLRFLIFLLLCGTLHAHLVLEAQLSFEIQGEKVIGVAEADSSYLLSEFHAMDVSPGPRDLGWLRAAGPMVWKEIEAEVSRHWHQRLTIEADGVAIPWGLKIGSFHQTPLAFLRNGNPSDPPDLMATMEATLPPGTRKVEAVWRDPLAMVLMLSMGKGSEERLQPVLSGGRALVAIRTTETESNLQVATPSLGKWIHLGFEHILPKGVDHILFVLGLFLLAPQWKPLLQQTLIFTLAHSISLAAASLGWVKLPSTPVEVMIAVSIGWIGVENLAVKDLHKGRLFLVGAFGLIHGLGFAGVLADLLPADQPDKLPAALFGFNVGVELGQITVLLLAFACFGWLGERFRYVKIGGSILVALAGVILVGERVSGIELVSFL